MLENLAARGSYAAFGPTKLVETLNRIRMFKGFRWLNLAFHI